MSAKGQYRTSRLFSKIQAAAVTGSRSASTVVLRTRQCRYLIATERGIGRVGFADRQSDQIHRRRALVVFCKEGIDDMPRDFQPGGGMVAPEPPVPVVNSIQLA
jgi:hypothetical protein